ncbi:hypothetical protein C8R42DRAFT_597917 [Lentinula raphanica]|nr:hypothetical protein C8R42DRAFT_597917 [Lentinula raphanica]
MSPRSDSEKTNTGRASLPRRVSPSRRATLPEASLPQRPSLPRKTKSTFPRSSRSPSQSSSGYSSYEHFVYGLGYSSESDHDVRTRNTAEHTPPPPFSGTIPSSSSSSSTPPLPTPPTLGGFPITTWSHTRSLLRNTPPPHRFSSETLFSNAEGKGAGGHTMHDYINAYGSHMRAYPQMRVVYEAMMRENTSWDEPNAPRIRICGEDDEDYLRDDAARDEGNKVEVTPPWEFYYTNEMLLGQGVLPPSRSQLTGCDCEGGRCHLNRNKCSCWKKQETFTAGYGVSGFMYEALQEGGNGNGVVLKANGLPVFECNSLCGCGEECRNRVVSRGRQVPITLKKTHKKGWGVFASSVIPKGTFIGIYSGELLGHEESEERAIKYDEFGRTYLFDIDCETLIHTPNRARHYTIDAYHAGNNHSCDPNAALTPVYIDVDEIERPLLTIFSKRRIRPGEEITFSYSGDPDMDEDENEPKDDKEDHDDDYRHHDENIKGDARVHVSCQCGAANCKGGLFASLLCLSNQLTGMLLLLTHLHLSSVCFLSY